MDSSKEVTQKLTKLNIDSPVRAPVQDVNVSRPPNRNHTPFGLARQACFQTQSTQASLNNNRSTHPGAIAATVNTPAGPGSPKNIPLRKPLNIISRNLAESLAKGVKARNPGRHTTSITKYRDKMRMGVDFLRRDASKGLKRWLKEKERRHDRRATKAHRGAVSEGLRKSLGLKREGANLGVIKEEEEEEEKEEEDVKMEEDMVMTD